MVDVTDPTGYFTWTVTGSPTVRSFVNGDKFILDSGSGVEITNITPATPCGSGNTARNGCMVNPMDQVYHGLDGRIGDPDYPIGIVGSIYDQSLNKANTIPFTLYAGDSLICCVSSEIIYFANSAVRDTFTVGDIITSNTGGRANIVSTFSTNGLLLTNITGPFAIGESANDSNTGLGDITYMTFNSPYSNQLGISRMAVLTIIAAADDPGANVAFRPPYMGNTKPIFKTTDIDYSVLPNLTCPSNPFTGTYPLDSNGYKDFHYDKPSAGSAVDLTIFKPFSHDITGYPGTIGSGLGDQVARCAILSCFDLSPYGGSAQDNLNQVIQLGIDNVYWIKLLNNPRAFKFGAGYGCGRMFAILTAARFLNHPEWETYLEEDTANTALYQTINGEQAKAFNFKETNTCQYSSNTVPYWPTPRSRSNYRDGKIPIYGDTTFDPPTYGQNNITMDEIGNWDATGRRGPIDKSPKHLLSGGYMYCCSAHSYPGYWMAAHFYGWDTTAFRNPAFADWTEKWAYQRSHSYGVNILLTKRKLTDYSTSPNVIKVYADIPHGGLKYGFKVRVKKNNLNNTSSTIYLNINDGEIVKTVRSGYSFQGATPQYFGVGGLAAGSDYYYSYSDYDDCFYAGLVSNLESHATAEPSFRTDIYKFGGGGNGFIFNVYKEHFRSKYKSVVF